MIGYTLYLGTQDAWFGFRDALICRLNRLERISLAFMALKALNHYDAVEVANHALVNAGRPMVVFDTYMNDAANWADYAPPQELEAYCLACFNRMTPKRKKDFLSYIQQGGAA